MRESAAIERFVKNVLLLQTVGIRVVLVHGGGPEIDIWLKRLGIEKKTLRGLRVTDDETMAVVEMALAGRANKQLVAEIVKAGGRAVGLSGRDDDLLQAEVSSEDLGRVGDVTFVKVAILEVLLEEGIIPVICTVANDAQYGSLNVNADSAAAAIAAALDAEKLILLTDTSGVLADKDDVGSRISELTSYEAEQMIADGRADRGMIPKLQAAIDAKAGGVRAVHMINGGQADSLLIEVFTDDGIGTMLV